MRTRRIPMTFEEFEMLPRKLGFKHEYLDGQAWISPGHGTVVLTVPVEQRPIPAPFRPRPVAESDAPALGATFVKAFADAVEFCDFSADRIRKSARESIEGFFSGARGRPLPASRLCEGEGGVEGAALLLRTCHGTALDLLFVRPARQRLGLGTALVASASNELAAAGEEKLLSQHHLGNEASTEWHRRFGFVEEPDLMISQQRLRCARHELRRWEKLGGLTAGERGRLRAECGRLPGWWRSSRRSGRETASRRSPRCRASVS